MIGCGQLSFEVNWKGNPHTPSKGKDSTSRGVGTVVEFTVADITTHLNFPPNSVMKKA